MTLLFLYLRKFSLMDSLILSISEMQNNKIIILHCIILTNFIFNST